MDSYGVVRAAACLIPLLLLSCGDVHPDHRVSGLQHVELSGAARVAAPFPFLQASFYLGGATAAFDARVRRGGDWSAWAPVEVTWSEPPLHVGRVILEVPADALDLRGEGYADVLFHAAVDAPAKARAADLPYATAERALAPADLVISRHEWGARDPERVCNQVVDPYRMTIHHTASPNDGPDAAGRMRQIQAFHIDGRGWCDIGYHFVVSQAGDIFQGRSDERRPGAHVGGHNAGNIGVCLMGHYDEQVPPEAQIEGAARIVGWASRTYDISLDRDTVRGHQEWPGQATACPGRNLLPRVDDILVLAGEVDDPPPPPPDAAPPPPPPDAARPPPPDYAVAPEGALRAELDRSGFTGGLTIRMTPRGEVAGDLFFRNIGTETWTPALTRLATARPNDHDSDMRTAGWLSGSRPTEVEGVVRPGEVGRFVFGLRASGIPGDYVEHFTLVQIGSGWFEDTEVTFDVHVLPEPDGYFVPTEDAGRPPVRRDAFVGAGGQGGSGGFGGRGGGGGGQGGGAGLGGSAGQQPVGGDDDATGCNCDAGGAGGLGAPWLVLMAAPCRRRRRALPRRL